MKKRILACLLALTMLVVAMPISAEGSGIVFTVNVPKTPVEAGETFHVTVDISGNSGIGSLEMTLTYDRSLMECKTILAKDVLLEMMSAMNPDAEEGAMLAAASASGVTSDGLIASYKFVAKETISDYDVGLTDVRIADADGAELSFEVFRGSDKQEEAEPDVYVEQPVASSRPSVSGNSFGNVTIPKDEEPVITEPDNDDVDEEIFETEVEVPDVTVHLFGDTKDHWAEPYINKAVEIGLFKGDDKGNFNPEANITRAQFITVLWRMSGSLEAKAEAPFEDIKDQIGEFQSAIAWGYENGYINGVSETAFNPDGTLTREAGMKILHYFSGSKTGNEFMFIDVYDNAFEDSKNISSWAKMSMYWGVYNKLISGITSTQLAPQGVATRAQVTKILVDYRDTFIQ